MIRDTSAQDRVIQAPLAKLSRPVLYALSGLAVAVALGLSAPSVARWFSVGSSVSAARLRIAEVKRGDLIRDVSVQGKVVAAVSPTLYAPAPGTIDLAIHAGEKVEKNQVLAEVDSPELESKLLQEQATLASLETDVGRSRIDTRKKQLAAQKLVDQANVDRTAAQRELERNEAAFKKGAIAQMEVLRATDVVAKADLALNQARQDIALEKESLDFETQAKELARDRQRLIVAELARQVESLKIRAPVAGQVGTLLVQQKANVAQNAPLMTVVDLGVLEVEVQVPETFAKDLSIGMPAEIANGAQKLPGELSAVSPEVVAGQVIARVRFKDPQPTGLRQSQRLSTRILIDEHPNVLMVERGPFVDSGAGRLAYVVSGNTAERRAIEVGATSLNAVEIVSGLKEGERIVISSTDEFNGQQRVALAR